MIAARPIDFRCGHDGPVAAVQNELGFGPHSGLTVVCRSKRGNRLKILLWGGSGLVMVYKRLDEGAFAWPAVTDGVIRISRAQYEALFSGLDWRRTRTCRVRAPGAASWITRASDARIPLSATALWDRLRTCRRPPSTPRLFTGFRSSCTTP